MGKMVVLVCVGLAVMATSALAEPKVVHSQTGIIH